MNLPRRAFAAFAALLAFVFAVGTVLPAHATAKADAAVQGATAEVRPAPPEVPTPLPAIVVGQVETRRFRLLYTKKSEGEARALAQRIEAVRDDFQKVLGRDWPGITEIRVGVGRDEFDALALPGGEPPKWAEALAYPGRGIILLDALSLSKPQGEITLKHELSHAALGQLGGNWPHWFQEGLAMYLTGDRISLTQYAAMFRAVTQDRIFRFTQLTDGWPQHPGDVEIAYAQSVSFVSYLIDTYGPAKMGDLVDAVHGGMDFDLAFARSLQSTLRVEQEAWEKTLPARYSWMPIVTGGTALWTFAAALTVVGWVRRRKTQAARLAEMSAEEAAEDAAERLARSLSQLPEATATPAPPDAAPWPHQEAEAQLEAEPELEPHDEPGPEDEPTEDEADPLKTRRILH